MRRMLRPIITDLQVNTAGNNAAIAINSSQIATNTTQIAASASLITTNTTQIQSLNTQTVSLSQQVITGGTRGAVNISQLGFSVDNILKILAANSLIDPIVQNRTVTLYNSTAATNLDLYLTQGGSNPLPIAKLATLPASVGSYTFTIPNSTYNWSGNFTAMPQGQALLQFNSGPTIIEFGFNQIWSGSTPVMRDTFDISTVPSGLSASAANGPRSLAVQQSQAAGFSVQQSYNYNFGVQITPLSSSLALPTQTVTCTAVNGDSPNSIGYPNDTAYPKQQTGFAECNYAVYFLDPVVSLP